MANEARQKMRRSTRRLVGLLTLPTTLVIVGCMFALFLGVLRSSQDAILEEAQGVLATLAYTFNPGIPQTALNLNALADSKRYQRLWVIDTGGRIVASNVREEVGEPPGPQWTSWVQAASGVFQGETISYGGAQLFVASFRNTDSGYTVLALVPVVDAGFFDRALLWVMVLAFTMWVGVVGFLYIIVTSRIRGPLLAVASTLEQAKQGTEISAETLDRLMAQSAVISGSLVTNVFALLKKYQRSKRRFQATVEQFRKLLDLTPLSISIFSEDGKLIEANATFYKNLELPLPAKRADPGMPIAPHIPLQQIISLGERSAKERCTFSNVEAAFVNARQQQVPTRIHVQAVKTEERTVYFVVAENRAEQTQLHSKLSDFNDAFSLRVEEQTAGLRHSVQRLETFINEAGVLFAVFDREHKTLFWNKAVADRAGTEAPHMSTLERFIQALVHVSHEHKTMKDWLTGSGSNTALFKTATRERDWILHWTQAKDIEGNLILTGLPVHVPKPLPAVSSRTAPLPKPTHKLPKLTPEPTPKKEAKRSTLDSLPDLDLGDSWDDDLFLDEDLGGALDVEAQLERDSADLPDQADVNSDDTLQDKTSD